MADSSPWPTIHAERKALAADLEGVTDEQWAMPSLCAGWTVRDVLAHMTATAEMSPGRFFTGLIGSGFRFNALANKEIAKRVQGPPGDTLARFKENLTSSTAPPGPVDTWLGETIVHSEDIRRPLGISHVYPSDGLTRVADFYKRGNLVTGGKRRIAGLTLRATDTAWTSGSGPEVSGPMLALVLAMVGRPAALVNLTGDGVATLQSRM